MRKFLVEIQFNGKNYSGFQRVSTGVSIEEKICYALEKLFETKIEINGCSRTDAGVSAESYYFDFSVDTKLPTERIPFKLNRFLPKDIQAQSAIEVDDGFHARYNAISKTYEYGFYVSDLIMPLLNPKNYRLPTTININQMEKACALLIGNYNFSAFKTPSKDKVLPVRTIFDCRLIKDGKRLIFQITGDGFLYNMVRIIAGTLVKIGENSLTLEDFTTLLKGYAERKDNPAITLPPTPLTLKSVNYKF